MHWRIALPLNDVQIFNEMDKIKCKKRLNKPRNVLSMMLKLEIFERKSEARGAYGLRCGWSVLGAFEREDPRFPLALTPFVSGTWTMSLFAAGKTSPFE